VFARALALALVCAATAAAAQAPVPPLSARVTDLTGTLDAGQRSALEARLTAFERAKGSQVVVLIVPTSQPEEIEQFAIRVADAWKIGRAKIDDGVIVLLAIDDHAVRIEVGRGLEGVLPDAIANRITDEVMVPRFRVGDYYGGLSDGVERIIATIEGEPLPPPTARRDPMRDDTALWVAIVVPLLIGGLVRAVHNRASGAVVAGGLSWGLSTFWIGGASAALMMALFCAMIVFGANARGGRGGWASGGYGGGGFGGGGGGFSGGGGGFGGGGASGRW